MTNAGGGASFCRGRAVTRWRQDATCDPGGQYLYLRDVRSGRVWSATHQPTSIDQEDDVVTFTIERATFQRKVDEIGTQLDVAVSPEDDVEVRRLTLTNHGDRARELEVTSYAEIVLRPFADDLAHPAFGKLFIESEYLAESNALLCRRRPRAPDDAEVFAVHVLSQEGRTQGPVEWESDRGRFLGRGHDTALPRRSTGVPSPGAPACCSTHREPAAARAPAPGRSGAALLRHRHGLQPGDRPGARPALPRPDRHRADLRARLRTRPRRLHHSASPARRHSCSSAWPQGCCTPTARSAPARRSSTGTPGTGRALGSRRLGRPPYPALRIAAGGDLGLVRQVLQAQEYWRLKGLSATW